MSSVSKLLLAYAPDNVAFRYVATMREGNSLLKLSVFVAGLFRLLHAFVTFRPDLVHIHFSKAGSVWRKGIVAFVARLCRTPYILHAHGGEFREFFAKVTRFLRLWILLMLRRACFLVVLSENWREFYQGITQLPQHRVVILPNPVVLPPFVPERAQRSTVTLLFLGRMSVLKGPKRILEAVALLPQAAREKVHVVLAGDGDVAGVRDRMAELGLDKQVTVLDWVDSEKRDSLLASADVYVLPSLNEGLPMSVLEAMSWGLPVVASPVGGIPEVVQDGFNGFLVPPTDIPAISQAIQRLVEDEPLRLQMGANARASVEPLNITRYWQSLYELYRSVLEETAN